MLVRNVPMFHSCCLLHCFKSQSAYKEFPLVAHITICTTQSITNQWGDAQRPCSADRFCTIIEDIEVCASANNGTLLASQWMAAVLGQSWRRQTGGANPYTDGPHHKVKH